MQILEGNMPLALWVIAFLGLIALIPNVMLIYFYRRMKRFEEAHLSLQTFMSGKTLDVLLQQYLNEVAELSSKINDCHVRLTKAENKLRASVDRVELIRFNAFENMGSDLSFALALLNQDGNGVVISSINSREETRVYAKPIIGGNSSYHLSAEEKQVIAKAQENIKI